MDKLIPFLNEKDEERLAFYCEVEAKLVFHLIQLHSHPVPEGVVVWGEFLNEDAPVDTSCLEDLEFQEFVVE